MDEDLEPRHNLKDLGLSKSPEDWAFHDDAAGSRDSALRGDRTRGAQVVSGTHFDGIAGLVTFRNCVTYTFTEGDLNTGDPNECRVLSEVFVWHLKLDIINRVVCVA